MANHQDSLGVQQWGCCALAQMTTGSEAARKTVLHEVRAAMNDRHIPACNYEHDPFGVADVTISVREFPGCVASPAFGDRIYL